MPNRANAAFGKPVTFSGQCLFHRQPVHSAVRQDRLAAGRSVSFCGTDNACFIISLSFAVRKDRLAAERSVSFCGTDNACSIVSPFTPPSARTPPGPLTANTVIRQVILPHKADTRGEPRAKVLYKNTPAPLYKRAFILYEYEKDFKFLGKGRGGKPLYKEGFPRKTLLRKNYKCAFKFLGKGQGKTALYKEGFSLENFSEENYKRILSFSRGSARGRLFSKRRPLA